MVDEEPFGTTPIPTSSSGGGSLEVTLDLWSKSADVAQQPQTQQIAVYEATPNEDCINGSLLDVNQHFVVYAVKNGLIRVLHRHSAMRALLRGHQNQIVTDISFFLDGDVLATVGHSKETGVSTLIVWRVFEQSPEIQSEKLLEVSSNGSQMNRLLWHPFNPNQVWVMHSVGRNLDQQVATLVETTRIQTTTHPEESHPVCHWHSPTQIMEGAVQLQVDGGSLTDLAWSGRDSRHVLTTHSNGQIILWDLKQMSGVVANTPKKLVVIDESPDSPQSRCMFLPHDNAVRLEGQTETLTTCFITASHQNTVITLWSSFTSIPDNLPVKLQVLKLANPSPSYVLDLCFGPAPQEASPPSCFLLWADRHKGQLLAVHIASQWNSEHKALCVGSDYVVPFVLKHPIYSWCVVCAPTQDISDDDIAEHQGLIFDMKLFSYQSKLVQCLTLTSYMCLPPEHGYQDSTTGVSVQGLLADENGAGAASEIDTVEPEYDEEYDVDDDDDDEIEEKDSMAPAPPSAIGTSNPFANWLGALAGGSSTPAPATDLPPPPPPPTQATANDLQMKGETLPLPPGLAGPPPGLLPGIAASSNQQPLLNPMDLMASAEAPAAEDIPQPDQAPTSAKVRSTTPNKQNKNKGKKSRSKSPKNRKNKVQSPFPDGAKISILKREDKPSMPASTGEADPSAGLPSKQISQGDATFSDPAIVAMTPPPPTAAMSLPPLSADPNLEATLSRVISQEFAKQPAIGQAVEQSLESNLIPAVNKVVQESLASFGRPLNASMDRLGQQGVRVDPKDLQAALDLETPLKTALAETMRTVFIPAMESMTAQILHQAKQTPPPPPVPDMQMKAALEALTQQLVAMNSKMEAMSTELQALKSNSIPHPPTPPLPTPAHSVPNKLEITRNEVVGLLQQKQYQAAFTKAVSSGTPDMVVFACSRADLTAVLGGNSPQLSQPILLCLMQQLGAALATTTSAEFLNVELEWLQEIALTLNASDPNIQRHVPAVLQGLGGTLNQKIAQGDPQFRRPLHMLLQVIRGMQMG